jgi:hypothetical protein
VPLVIRVESAPEPVRVQASAEQPHSVQPAAEPASTLRKQPQADLASVGLQLVETAAPTPTNVDDSAEPSASPRRRRSRGGRGNLQTNVQPAAEALVLVETRSGNGEAAPAAQAGNETPSEWGPPSNPRRRARPAAESQAAAEPLVMVETRSTAAE